MEIDFATVSTSMLSSGGVLFAAYKIWFERRLEDHKHNLQNDAKLFEIEIAALETLSLLVIRINKSKLEGVDAEFTLGTRFLMAGGGFLDDFSSWVEKNSFLLSEKICNNASILLIDWQCLMADAIPYVETNRSWGGSHYRSYKNLPDDILERSVAVNASCSELYLKFRKEIYRRAGR